MTATATERACPKCGGPMWNNIAKKQSGQFSPKSPDYSCKNKECGGAIWPPRGGQKAAPAEHNVGKAPWEDEQEEAEQQFVQRAKFRAGTDPGAALSHSHMVAEKLNELTRAYDGFFAHALDLAANAQRVDKQLVVTLDAVSKIAATLLIAAKERGLV